MENVGLNGLIAEYGTYLASLALVDQHIKHVIDQRLTAWVLIEPLTPVVLELQSYFNAGGRDTFTIFEILHTIDNQPLTYILN
jgi:hypothetical protein